MKRILMMPWLICGTLFVSGCTTLAPHYSQPAPPVASAWPAGPAYRADESAKGGETAAVDIPWRNLYVEPRLQKVIELALANNRDLRIAALTVERVQALYQIQRSNLLPKVDATAAATLQRIPETLSSTGKAVTTDQYSVGLGVSSYELDLFGRVASLKDQALEQYLASEQAGRSIRLSLISQAATAWLNLAADRERLQLAGETFKNQQEAYALTQNRYDVGLSSALVLNQARTTVDAARVDIARYTAQVAQDENILSQIVGSSVPADLLPSGVTGTITSVTSLSPGLSSTVLLQRPDILQAEAQLKAANASIGAARAAFFPKVTLVSSAGFGSDDLASLFKPGSFAWKFAPQITLPIFDAGSNAAGLTVARVDRDIAIAQYEKAIQTAFREVADALAQQGTIEGQLAAQRSLVEALAESHRISTARYDSGIDSYLNVLDAQRSLYAAETTLIGIRLGRLTNLVTLYKVLGGGLK